MTHFIVRSFISATLTLSAGVSMAALGDPPVIRSVVSCGGPRDLHTVVTVHLHPAPDTRVTKRAIERGGRPVGFEVTESWRLSGDSGDPSFLVERVIYLRSGDVWVPHLAMTKDGVAEVFRMFTDRFPDTASCLRSLTHDPGSVS